jgi:hypothetical protein
MRNIKMLLLIMMMVVMMVMVMMMMMIIIIIIIIYKTHSFHILMFLYTSTPPYLSQSQSTLYSHQPTRLPLPVLFPPVTVRLMAVLLL